ncbi:hypothetical protein Rsub_05468 [Raphidocelis subcapitata]|uniref:Ion transport domain-containing protein n=1 Tax=Raphidocelis subcapitata TaxID=307507 RepID=A0A2V0NZU6_9CHLO|nr:hypothetical protein Rsub_05468 [Raphidocelis subcapitata]|eukprot:GBF92849.1 hypothetical protein Rsub_05468 [Raphidocelis subcapitata]
MAALPVGSAAAFAAVAGDAPPPLSGGCTLCFAAAGRQRHDMEHKADTADPEADADVLNVYRRRAADVSPGEFVWLARGERRPRRCVAGRSVLGLPVARRGAGRALRAWRGLMLALDLTYTALFLPTSMALTDSMHSAVCWRVDMVAGAFFTADLLLALHLPWTITSCHQVARITNGAGILYLYRTKGSMFIDLLAVIPFVAQWFAPLITGAAAYWLLWAVFILRLLRLVRVASIVRALARGQLTPQSSSRLMSASGWYLFSVVYCAAVVINCFAAMWYLVARIGGPASSWLAAAGDRDLSNADLARRYLAALYFTVTTMTTTGYGDIVPTNELEEVAAIAMMLAATLFMSFVIGTVGGLLSQRSAEDQRAQRFVSKVAYLDLWFARTPTPASLERAVYGYYATQWARAQEEAEVWEQVVEGLPQGLRGQLVRSCLGFSLPGAVKRLGEGVPNVVLDHAFSLFERAVVPAHAVVCEGPPGGGADRLYVLEYGSTLRVPPGARLGAGPGGRAVAEGGARPARLRAPCMFPAAAVGELERLSRGSGGGGGGGSGGGGGGESSSGGNRSGGGGREGDGKGEKRAGRGGSSASSGGGPPREGALSSKGHQAHRRSPPDPSPDPDASELVWSQTMAIVWSVDLAALSRLCRRCPPLLDNFRRELEEQRRAAAGQRAEAAGAGGGGSEEEEGEGEEEEEEGVGGEDGLGEKGLPKGPHAV